MLARQRTTPRRARPPGRTKGSVEPPRASASARGSAGRDDESPAATTATNDNRLPRSPRHDLRAARTTIRPIRPVPPPRRPDGRGSINQTMARLAAESKEISPLLRPMIAMKTIRYGASSAGWTRPRWPRRGRPPATSGPRSQLLGPVDNKHDRQASQQAADDQPESERPRRQAASKRNVLTSGPTMKCCLTQAASPNAANAAGNVTPSAVRTARPRTPAGLRWSGARHPACRAGP